MANLTIVVNPDSLRLARIRALKRNESVNRILSDFLDRYAHGADEDAIEQIITFADSFNTRSVASSGTDRGWTREELYDV